jgi:hypothetical protein
VPIPKTLLNMIGSRPEFGGLHVGPSLRFAPQRRDGRENPCGPQATTIAAWPSLARRCRTAMIACRISQGACCIASIRPANGTQSLTVETRITGSIFNFHAAATVSRRSKIKNTSPCVMRSSGTMKVGMKYVACNIPGTSPEVLP